MSLSCLQCNATWEEVCFKELSSYSEIVDLRTICAAVGHLKVGDTWAIIDRSGPYAQTVFTDDSLTVTSTNTDLGHWSFFLFSSLSNYRTFNNGVRVIMDLRWCGYKLRISFFLFSFITLFYSACLLWVLRPSFMCLGLALKENKLIALIRCTPPVSGMRLGWEIFLWLSF